MSLARKHRDRVLAEMTALGSSGDVTSTASAVEVPFYASAQDRTATIAAAQIGARLTHDLRRLSEIKSIAHKIAAKREMLPEYADWIDGLLSGAQAAGAGVSGDVLPTIMVWRIDVGDFAGAMSLIEHVLAHKVAMPTRYARDAATLIVEEIADAAIKAQSADEPFDLAILEQVEALTADDDMHDQVRAKLLKAIGFELNRGVDGAEPGVNASTIALDYLRRAQALHDRVGVKTTIKAVEKRLAAAKPDTAGSTG